ncbi:MAG: matrixin family metalloprotease [Chloroflexi bacterium]|nr:matrixin family metalloprotease [Chloroflexota bacterium]
MRVAVWVLSAVLLAILLPLSTGRVAPGAAGERLFVHAFYYAGPVATCTSPGPDSGVYKLTGYKLPSTSMVYKTNQNSFPAYLSRSEVQAAIDAAFATWDGATSKALFANGGTTTAKIGWKDNINAVGFRSLSGGYVGMAYGWVNSRTKTLTEFDVALSSNYNWATNIKASGDCGGAANAFDVRSVATHEVGHPVGLNDLNDAADSAQTMYGYLAYQELYKRTLASGDLAGLKALYGP